MSLYYRGTEIREIDDALYAAWVAAGNPKSGDWQPLPAQSVHDPQTHSIAWDGAQWVVSALPPPPDDLQGEDLKVEYISIVAQAQKLLGVTAIERFVQFAGTVAQIDGSVVDRIDMDKAVGAYGVALGVPANMLLDDEAVAAIRAERAAAAQAQAQGDAMMKATEGARNLAQAPLTDDNVMNRLLEASGAPAPAGAA